MTPYVAFAQDNYFRIDRHYLDEGQFGFVPIDAPFNYVRGYGGGTENSLTYNLENLAVRANIFVAREEDIGVASGQYNFPADEVAHIDRHFIVLDHTPLVGASGGAAYRWKNYQFTFDGLFSSGLRGGFANETQLPKVWQFNMSAARDFADTGPRHVHEPYRAAQHFRSDQPDPARQWHRSFSGRLRAENHGIRRADRAVTLVVRACLVALRAARRSPAGGRRAHAQREHDFGPAVEDHVDTDEQSDHPETGDRPRISRS